MEKQSYTVERGWQTKSDFCIAQELRMFWTFLKGRKNKTKEEYVTQTINGLQNLKYLLSVPLQKTEAYDKILLSHKKE